MRLLAIETATGACSVALFEDSRLIGRAHEIVGRGHAERLIPMIAGLPGGGRADTILVDCGPGSFTGVRVGLAAARGLGIGWGNEVRGFSSLALIAAAGFAARPEAGTIAVAIIGGHGELFVQRFACGPLRAMTDLASLPPAQAASAAPDDLVLGSGAPALVAVRGFGIAHDVLPDAAHVPLLPARLAGLRPSPIYGRAPDARPAAA